MFNRTLKRTAVVYVSFSLVLAYRVFALEIVARGTYVDDATGQPDAWEGHFLVGGTRLEGTLTRFAKGKVTQGGIEGSISGDRVEFASTAALPTARAFTGRFSGNDLSGVFTSGAGQRQGTWQGRWDVAPGAPAPEVVEPEVLQPPGTLVSEVSGLRLPIDPDDPYALCPLLQDQRQVGLMSSGLYDSLVAFCSDQSPLSGFGSGSFAARLAQTLSLLLQPAAGLLPSLGRAFGQSCGVLTNPVNCRAADTYSAVSQNEVSIAVASDQHVVVAGYVDSGHVDQGSRVGYSRSTDGGNTWTDMGFPQPLPSGGSNEADPVLATDGLDFFYFAHIARASGRQFIAVRHSSDLGLTFGSIADASQGTPAANGQDKPEMAVDQRTSGGCPSGNPNHVCAGNIYVCWAEDAVDQGGVLQTRIQLSRSTNRGLNYTIASPPVTDFGPVTDRHNVEGCAVAVTRTGTLVVAWWDRGTNPLDPNLTNAVRTRQSIDGGMTFGPVGTIATTRRAPSQAACPINFPALNGNVRLIRAVNLATDPLVDNNVYAAWHTWDTNLNSSEVMFSRSTDSGATWLRDQNGNPAPVRLNDTTTNDQFFPRIATRVYHGQQPNLTEIRVIWYDRRRDTMNPNKDFDVYSDTSLNAGATWQTDTRLTDTPAPLPLPPQLNPNFDCKRGPCSFGDYIALRDITPNGSDLFISGWGDTRLTASSPPGSPCGTGPASSPDPDVRVLVGC